MILQDLDVDMLAFARERAAQRDVGNVDVEFVPGDLEALELEPGSLDAIVARAVLMYLADPAGTLQRLRPALKPGGRFAASSWATPDKVAFAAPVPLIFQVLELPPPPPGRPGLFALADRLYSPITQPKTCVLVDSWRLRHACMAKSPRIRSQATSSTRTIGPRGGR